MGQSLSLLICGTAVISQLLQDPNEFNTQVPTAQSFLNYVLLCLVYTTTLSCRAEDRGLLPVLRKRGWKYFIVAVIDVEANYMIVKAYQNTTLTSVQLLDCFTIPVVLVLSWIFLKIRYKLIHIVGVGVCLVGVGSLIWADALGRDTSTEQAPNKLLGDMLCIAAASCYAMSNVAQEFCVRNYDFVEFLGMIGLFGSVVNGLQLSIIERQEVLHIRWDIWQVVVLLVSYAVCMFVLYSLFPLVIKATSATAVNLSLLSADFYVLLIGMMVFHFQFSVLYFVAFAVIITGVLIYSMKRAPYADDPGERTYGMMEEEGVMAESNFTSLPSRSRSEEMNSIPVTTTVIDIDHIEHTFR